jgi:hypothetical protein
LVLFATALMYRNMTCLLDTGGTGHSAVPGTL